MPLVCLLQALLCGGLSLGCAYAWERQQRQAFAAARGDREAELELSWRRVSTVRAVTELGVASCLLWQVLSTVLGQ